MNAYLLGDDKGKLNTSAFNDDSFISEDEDSKIKYKSNFLLKSSTNKSLEKDLNKIHQEKKDSLQSNLVLMSPDGIDINNRNGSSTYSEVMLEDIFSNSYEIPMNRPSKFSISKMGHKFLYESNSKVTNYKIDSKKFGLSKNSEIVTYLLNLFVFSEFLNLEELEKDKRFKVIFIKQNKIQKKFIVENTNNILNSLEIPNERANDFNMFINGINYFLSENEYLNLQKKNKKKILSVYIILALILLLIIGIGIAMYFSIKILINDKKSEPPPKDSGDPKDKENGNKHSTIIFCLVLESIILFIFIIGLIIKILDAKNLKLLFIYYDLRYLLINYKRIIEHIEIWNENLFENYKIRASIPISINYIMFNLNPYQNIEIKHHNMDWMKKKFYKSQSDIFKTEKEQNLFRLIKNNIFQNNERLSLSIN